MINRQKLIEALEEVERRFPYKVAGKPDTYREFNMAWESCMDCVFSAVESQPPADVPDTNVGEWIPCSERLPKDGQTVPVTVVLWKEKRILSHATYHAEKPTYWHPYDWNGEGFYIHDSELGECKYEDVVAWLNVEPYKGVE